MKTPILISILAMLILASCTNSAKQQADQQAREKFIADSVANVIQQKAAAVQAKADLQKSVEALDSRRTS